MTTTAKRDWCIHCLAPTESAQTVAGTLRWHARFLRRLGCSWRWVTFVLYKSVWFHDEQGVPGRMRVYLVCTPCARRAGLKETYPGRVLTTIVGVGTRGPWGGVYGQTVSDD